MNRPCQLICQYGSVAAAAQLIGEEAAARAMHELTQLAPMEVRGHPDLVISWSQLTLSYKQAAELNDAKLMSDIAMKRLRFLKELH